MPEHIGLVSSEPFSVLGLGHEFRPEDAVETQPASQAQQVEISYNAADETYLIGLPGFEAGALNTLSYDGTGGQVATSTWNSIEPSGGGSQSVRVSLQVPGSGFSPWTYTSLGSWYDEAEDDEGRIVRREGVFAYGIPTSPLDMPLSGTASYGGDVIGRTADGNYVGGTAALDFDFGSGTLTGSMHPLLSDGWDLSIDLGTYAFKDTSFAKGSTTFSGSFDVPGLPGEPSWFEGAFNGPQAAEVMARWQAPYLLEGKQGAMFGIMIGEK
ncbi:hypothetical protein [Novosphingobium mathurense]|nr:hypothetical protein [Novosphingobium mathurense]